MNIVLTGASKAGKTAVLKSLKEYFKDYGNIAFLEESAILAIGAFRQLGHDFNMDELQKAIVKLQVEQEDKVKDLSIIHHVIQDRGIADGIAYNPDYYSKLDKDLVDICRYDAVLFLSTIALNGDVYDQHNNEEHRIHDKEDALRNHADLYEIYKDHPRFIELELHSNVQDLVNDVIDNVNKLIRLEVEYKFKFEGLEDELKDLKGWEEVDLEQIYITPDTRVRKEKEGVFILTTKVPFLDGKIEWESEAWTSFWESLLKEWKPLTKKRISKQIGKCLVCIDQVGSEKWVEIETFLPLNKALENLGWSGKELTPYNKSNYDLWKEINERI